MSRWASMDSLRAHGLEALGDGVCVPFPRALVQQVGGQGGKTWLPLIPGASGLEGDAHIQHGQIRGRHKEHGDARGGLPGLDLGRGLQVDAAHQEQQAGSQSKEAISDPHVRELPWWWL